MSSEREARHVTSDDVLGDLTEAESEAVRRFERQRGSGSRPLSVPQLLRDWASLVDEVEAGYMDGIDEYLHDVYTRTLLEDLSEQAPDALATRLRDLLGPLDHRFRSATRPDDDGRLAALFRGARGWWWRVPIAGEIPDHLAHTSET